MCGVIFFGCIFFWIDVEFCSGLCYDIHMVQSEVMGLKPRIYVYGYLCYVVVVLCFGAIMLLSLLRSYRVLSDISDNPDDTASVKQDVLYYQTAEWNASVHLLQDTLDISYEQAGIVMQALYEGYETCFGYPCYGLSDFTLDAKQAGVYHVVSNESVGAVVTFDENFTVKTIREDDGYGYSSRVTGKD